MPDDPATRPRHDESARAGGEPVTLRRGGDSGSASERLTRVLLAGHAGHPGTARRALGDPDPRVRRGAIGALARCGGLSASEVLRALGDDAPPVRRRAAEASAAIHDSHDSQLARGLRSALGDDDALVVEAACWSLGERREVTALRSLASVAREHDDPRCREAAVAALGAIGRRDGLPAVLDALADRPGVRRRAVVALAAFTGGDVETALRRCLEDPDWQVRQSAEILLDSWGSHA